MQQWKPGSGPYSNKPLFVRCYKSRTATQFQCGDDLYGGVWRLLWVCVVRASVLQVSTNHLADTYCAYASSGRALIYLIVEWDFFPDRQTAPDHAPLTRESQNQTPYRNPLVRATAWIAESLA
jgi:hypothetical protein